MAPRVGHPAAEIPTGRVARTLTLIAKVIQNLANMVTVFDKEVGSRDACDRAIEQPRGFPRAPLKGPLKEKIGAGGDSGTGRCHRSRSQPYMKCTSDFLTLHLEAMRMTIDRFSVRALGGAPPGRAGRSVHPGWRLHATPARRRQQTPSQQGDIEMDMLHDQRDLSREMSALQRHCVEKFEELLAASRDSKVRERC